MRGLTRRMGRFKEKNIHRIEQLAEEGNNAQEIADALNLKERTIEEYAYHRKISLPGTNPIGRPRINTEQKRKEIQRVLAEGNVRSRGELARRVGLSPKSLGRFDRLPSDLEPYRWRPELDRRIANGEAETDIGEALRISRQAVDDYIKRSGQRVFWQEKRQERKDRELLSEKERQQTLELIAGRIWALVEQKAREQGWAYEKALEYCQKSQRRTGDDLIPFEKLVKAYAAYDEAKKLGEKIGLRELARRAGFSHVWDIGRTYRIAGVKPFYGNREICHLSSAQKAALELALPLGMGAPDIGYFLNIPDYVVCQKRTKQLIQPPRKQGLHTLPSQDKVPGVRFHHLTYRLASQIYESVDLGFTAEETQQLLSTPDKTLHPKILEYALQHRPEIEQPILHALDTMFPEKRHEKPYKE